MYGRIIAIPSSAVRQLGTKAPLTLGRLMLNPYLYTKREKLGLEMLQY